MSDSMMASEVEVLPNGTPITVTWSGGNGPHDYVIAVDKWGHRYAARNDDPEDRLRFYNPLTYVGKGRGQTHVWRRG